ncbi:MAG TPA: 16S rRNA (adenine(1518)-N(6)/adenine(1519)-N(6))-dimethyltransferase RsmA [Planctomycetota bacterium]|nr:16S rRNA (adenine(1518)-N(6)/adenine(1519)-N(6))-dimethyltransferase RsmA [Planctomycetota bacterium]
MSLRHQVQEQLARAGLAPLHRLGQNFMIDESALAALVGALELAPGDRVVEIGPGTGLLSERMLDAGAQVLAVELDRGLAGLLGGTLVPRGLTLVHGDALAAKSRLHPAIEEFSAAAPGGWKLGANLPYDIAIPALLNALTLPTPPRLVAVTVQYEAAERLVSRPGDDAWGASAAVAQAAGEPRIVRRLPPSAFYPQPRVDSAILRVRPRGRVLAATFPGWCRRVFAARRKVLPRALRDAGSAKDVAEAACAACGLALDRRLEQLGADELTALHAALGAPGPETP